MLRLLSLVIFALSTFADDPFFQYEVDFHPDRTYFQSGEYALADTEYDSMRPGPTFLPIILDRWPREPLPPGTFLIHASQYATDDSIQHVWNFLLGSEDPLARSYLINKLATLQNKTSARLLEALLAGGSNGRAPEPDSYVKADILKALRLLNCTLPNTSTYIHDDDHNVRREAILLYCSQPGVDVAILTAALDTERHPLEVETLWEQLALVHEQTTIDTWAPCWASQSPEAVAQAVGVTMKQPQWSTHHAARIAALAADAHPLIQRAIADHMAADIDADTKQTLLRELADTPNASVRAAVASTIGRLEITELLPELMTLTNDPKAIVRREAAISLAVFPNRQTFVRLVELCGDGGGELLRDAALDTLESISIAYPVEGEAGEFLSSNNEDIRYNLYRLLDRLKSSMYNEIIRARLSTIVTAAGDGGERTINIAAAIRALSTGGDRAAANHIGTFKDHADPNIREQVARMVGLLKPSDGPKIISQYVLRDRIAAVRKAALLSLDETRGPHFGPTLLEILQRTDYTSIEILTANDRAIAAWILSRMPLAEPIRDRLKIQLTEKVIQTELGPIFDAQSVRIPCLWCLAIHAKRKPNDAWLKEFMGQIIATMTRDHDDRPNTVPTGYNANYYAYQARQFLDDAPIERRIVRPRKRKLNYQPVK
jgi:hypothetical protein